MDPRYLKRRDAAKYVQVNAGNLKNCALKAKGQRSNGLGRASNFKSLSDRLLISKSGR